MIIVPNWLSNWLSKQPEYGMGYQKVTAKLSSGGAEVGWVLNSKLFVKQAEVSWRTILFDWDGMLQDARSSTLSLVDANIIYRSPESMRGVRRVVRLATASNARRELNEIIAMSANAAAKDAPIAQTLAYEAFKRFCVFRNDRRVTADGALTAGTFATTEEDAENVKTGAQAVSRYALENKQPASHVFRITPKADTKLQRGTVEPAYGEPGGGVEVIFVDGTTPGTVVYHEKLPDK